MNKIYWNDFFRIQEIRNKVLYYHSICNKCRTDFDTTWIVDNAMWRIIEFALADMRVNLWLVKTEVSKYAIELIKYKSAVRKELRWTNANKTEEKDNIVKDIEEKMFEFTEEYEQEKIRVEEMESNTRTHVRICEYFKSSFLCSKWDEKRAVADKKRTEQDQAVEDLILDEMNWVDNYE